MKKRSRIGLIVCGIMGALLGLTLIVGRVSAMTEEELVERSSGELIFYERCGTSGSSGECGITVSGSTIEEKIWSGLTSFMSEEQAAGVMGNMAHEGGFSPARHETTFLNSSPSFAITTNTNDSYGIGLIQWSFGRRVKLLEFIKEKASDLLDKYLDSGRKEYGGLVGSDFLSKAGDADTNTLVNLELCYLKQELESNDSYGGIMKTTTVDEASDYFLEHVEIPANIPGQRPIRRADAQKYYDQFHGKTIAGGSGSEGSSSGGSDPSCNACAQGSLNINGTAVCLAWPYNTDKDVWKYVGSAYLKGNSWTGGKATDAFNAAIDNDKVYGKNSNDYHKKWSHCPSIGASCDVGVGTTVRYSGVDDDFPRGLGEQLEHARKHPELWDVIDASGESPQAGDVVNNTASGHHTYIIVQDEKGDFYRAESGLCSNFFHISRKFKGFESGAKILRSKKAKNSTNGIDVEKGVSTSSLTGTITSGTARGNGDISASAIELAWPEGTPAKTYRSKAWDKFVEFFNSLPGHKNTGGQAWNDGKSCMVFVNTVLQYAGALKDSKTSSVTPELIKSDEWEEVGGEGSPGLKYSDLKPGDVLSYYGSGSPSDGATTYKGLGLKHEAIYAEVSGKGMIIEAGFEVEWGHVRSKKPKANKTIAGGWAPIVRVFRWKNQNSGSGCNICDEGDSADGQLKAGGFTTVEEATAFMQSYIDAASPRGKYYNKRGDITFGAKNGKIHDAGCPHGVLHNCVAFSQWFVNNYTTVGPNWNNTTNGRDLVGALEKKGLKRGNEPRPYAIFSKNGPSGAGHTGVILGVDSAKKKVIIGDAACNESSGEFYKPRAYERFFSEIKGWWYAYTDDVISMGGPLRNV